MRRLVQTYVILMVNFLCGIVYASDHPAPNRVIALSPHLAEIVFALGKGEALVAVSDFSDYPEEANELPSVANYNGVNFEQIVRLEPDLILAWQGGNKPQDIARLRSLGYNLHASSPQTLEEVAHDILEIGNRLHAGQKAQTISQNFIKKLSAFKRQYASNPTKKVFYYMWPKPLMSIGENAWATQLLSVCKGKNIFSDVSTDYPEVAIEQVVKRKPDIIVAAMNILQSDAEAFWQDYRKLIDVKVVVVNPDLLHRFTPRLLNGLEDMCKRLN